MAMVGAGALSISGWSCGVMLLSNCTARALVNLYLAAAATRHIRRDRSVEAVAEEEDERRGAVDHARTRELPAVAIALDAIVAGAGLAADDERPAIGAAIGAAEAHAGAFGDDVGERAADG